MNEKNKSLLRFALLSLVVGIVTFLIPSSIGLGAGGFDSTEVLSQFTFYLVGAVFFVFLCMAFVFEYVNKEKDSLYGSSIAFSSPGETPAIPIFKRFSNLQIALLSIIIFSILGLIPAFTQTTFTGISSIEQQFTPTSQLLFSTFLIGGAENLGAALVIAASLVGLRILGRKYNWGKIEFISYSFLLVPILTGIYWVINHLLRYSGQDTNLMITFLFGVIQAFLVIMTGSFVIGWILHMSNNFFYDISRIFSNETTGIYAITLVIIFGVLYYLIYKNKLFGKKTQDAIPI